jgi:hypothetical protein
LKFFFDNNLAAKIAKGLNGFVSPDHQVVHLKEQFAANTDDAVWMDLESQVLILFATPLYIEGRVLSGEGKDKKDPRPTGRG